MLCHFLAVEKLCRTLLDDIFLSGEVNHRRKQCLLVVFEVVLVLLNEANWLACNKFIQSLQQLELNPLGPLILPGIPEELS